MEFELKAFPIQNSDFELTDFDDEIILFSVSQEKAVYFNQTAQFIWRLCDGKNSINDLIDGLQQQYPNETDIKQQIIDALQQMLHDNVINISSSPTQ